ncbi:hypothetical protein IFT63_10465 [Stenotrophomonas sp. CFBP 13724]|jgi:hypothetical protein|uniref:hypothetical protein n=1 Tax=Stenotrophomonas sp. CFBP 13724 TaxID=2775298 RepID=UPI00177F8429|nr:hypothetical protein [Stenotrophomonas sp. CFBP 13724]MBD8644007.1 hypothetical protein [Stenotrophomonas sp. CFBP 13724]
MHDFLQQVRRISCQPAATRIRRITVEAAGPHYIEQRVALRRPSIALSLPNGMPLLEVRDSVVVEMVQNRELPPNWRDTPLSCTKRTLQAGSKVLGAATLVYALWSVINYIAPRGDSNTSGLPLQKPFDFDHL